MTKPFIGNSARGSDAEMGVTASAAFQGVKQGRSSGAYNAALKRSRDDYSAAVEAANALPGKWKETLIIDGEGATKRCLAVRQSGSLECTKRDFNQSSG
ncbi:MAG: hypothetical protein ABR555_14645 [Pyrinomonadaceae bacterium]